MIGLFTLGFNLQNVFGDILFAFSLMMWPLYVAVVVILTLTIYKTNEQYKSYLVKSLFMPLPGAIAMVALLYVLL